MFRRMSTVDRVAELNRLEDERVRLLDRIKDIKYTLSTMPAGTALGVWCMNAYLNKAEKELSKVEKEIASLS